MRNQSPSWLPTLVIGAFVLTFLNGMLSSILPDFIAFWASLAITISFTGRAVRFLNSVSEPPREAWLRNDPPSATRERQITPQDIAQQALRRAGNAPEGRGIRLMDVGLLAYDGGTQPKVLRTEPISAAATHLRPYMVIDFPYQRTGRGTITFELVDEHGASRFVAQQRYEVQPGQNFLTTQNWLPMSHEEAGGNWQLRISLGDHALALHPFKVTPDAGSAFRSYLKSDGEVDEWLTKAAAKDMKDSLSLDELLADQEEIDISMFREANKSRQVGERR
jgi:hypothetical protein